MTGLCHRGGMSLFLKGEAILIDPRRAPQLTLRGADTGIETLVRRPFRINLQQLQLRFVRDELRS